MDLFGGSNYGQPSTTSAPADVWGGGGSTQKAADVWGGGGTSAPADVWAGGGGGSASTSLFNTPATGISTAAPANPGLAAAKKPADDPFAEIDNLYKSEVASYSSPMNNANPYGGGASGGYGGGGYGGSAPGGYGGGMPPSSGPSGYGGVNPFGGAGGGNPSNPSPGLDF